MLELPKGIIREKPPSASKVLVRKERQFSSISISQFQTSPRGRRLSNSAENRDIMKGLNVLFLRRKTAASCIPQKLFLPKKAQELHRNLHELA